MTKVEVDPDDLDAAYLLTEIRELATEGLLQDSGVKKGMVYFAVFASRIPELRDCLASSRDSSVEEIAKRLEV